MSKFKEQIRRAFAITKKDVKIYYSKGPVVIFGLLFPLFLFLAYTIGRNMPLKELMSGLIGMTVFFTSTSVGPGIVPWETRSRTLERLICCPITFWAIILGDVLSSFIFGVAISIIPVIFTLTLGLDPLNFILLVAVLTLASFCFSALSVLLSSYPPTDIPATTMMMSSLVKFPLVFISGIFIPTEQLPQWGKIVSLISPLTYFTDISRHIILGKGCCPIIVDVIAIMAFTVAFMVAAMKIHERTLSRRIS